MCASLANGKENMPMIWEILTDATVFLLFFAVLFRCLRAWGMPAEGLRLVEGPQETSFTPSNVELWQIFVIALAFRAFMILVQAAIVGMLTDGGLTLETFENSYQQWDTKNYTKLAELGYKGHLENGEPIFIVFFPLYVWVIRIVSLLTQNTIAAGILVSSLSFAWGCCWLYRLAAMYVSRRTAIFTLLMFASYPWAFFYGLIHTESLFFLTTTAALYFLLQRKWGWYALWGAAAALTRMTGVLLVAPAVILVLKDLRCLAPPSGKSFKRSLWPFIKKLPLILAPVLGTVCYLLLNMYVDGSPFAFIVREQHWNNSLAWVGGVIRYIWDYVVGDISAHNAWAIWLPEFVLFWLLAALMAFSVRRKQIPSVLLTYGYVYWIMNYSFGWLLSAGRYIACGSVFFLFAAVLTEERPALRGIILMAQSMLMGLFLTAHIRGGQVF